MSPLTPLPKSTVSPPVSMEPRSECVFRYRCVHPVTDLGRKTCRRHIVDPEHSPTSTGVTRGVVLVALVPLVPLYFSVTRHYLGTSRELNRLHMITHSPVLNHFGETFSGAMTVRAFRKQVCTLGTHACCPRIQIY